MLDIYCLGKEKIESCNFSLTNLDFTKNTYWIHLSQPTEEDFNFLINNFHFEASTIEECRDSEHYPKMEDYEDYLFFVSYFPLEKPLMKDFFQTAELNIFLGNNYLITVQKEANDFLHPLLNKAGKSKSFAKGGVIFVFLEIMDSIAHEYISWAESLDQNIENLEDLILKVNEKISDREKKIERKMIDYKRRILIFKRLIKPQMEMLFRLSIQEHDLFSERDRLYLRNVYDHFERLSSNLDSLRDMIISLFDAYRTQTANKTNEIMKFLTIFSTLILPLTLITGYYGMNFTHMDELQWKNGLIIVWSLIGLSTVLLLSFFKFKKWI